MTCLYSKNNFASFFKRREYAKGEDNDLNKTVYFQFETEAIMGINIK